MNPFDALDQPPPQQGTVGPGVGPWMFLPKPAIPVMPLDRSQMAAQRAAATAGRGATPDQTAASPAALAPKRPDRSGVDVAADWIPPATAALYGMLGSAGGPAGAIGMAGLGGATGQHWADMIRKANNTPEAPASEGQALGRSGVAFLTNAAGQGLGEVAAPWLGRIPMALQGAARGEVLPARLVRNFPQFSQDVAGGPQLLDAYMLQRGIPMGTSSRPIMREVAANAGAAAQDLVNSAEGQIVPGTATQLRPGRVPGVMNVQLPNGVVVRRAFIPNQVQTTVPGGTVTMQTGNVGTTLRFPVMEGEALQPGPGMMPVSFPNGNVNGTVATPIPTTQTLQLPEQTVNQTVFSPPSGPLALPPRTVQVPTYLPGQIPTQVPVMRPAINITGEQIANRALGAPEVSALNEGLDAAGDKAQVQQVVNTWLDQNRGRIGLDRLNAIKKTIGKQIEDLYAKGGTTAVAAQAPNQKIAGKAITDAIRSSLEDVVPGLADANAQWQYAKAAQILNSSRSAAAAFPQPTLAGNIRAIAANPWALSRLAQGTRFLGGAPAQAAIRLVPQFASPLETNFLLHSLNPPVTPATLPQQAAPVNPFDALDAQK